MDNYTPSIVDEGIVVDDPIIQAPLKLSLESQEKVRSEKRSGKTQPAGKWKPAEYFKDAAWFAAHFGLPNEGETPHSISDVTDEQLSACFGEKTRNGFKLSTCTGIPVELILALTQVVDGYEKPVNGVLSHTFAKGAYAERVLKRKVNWAAYSATKLKGQLLQWEREGKGKPDGPPCIRTPRMYKPPIEEASNLCPVIKSEDVKGDSSLTVHSVDCALVPWNAATSSLPTVLPALFEKTLAASSTPNVLLTIAQSEHSNMRKRQSDICNSLSRVDAAIAELHLMKEDILSSEGKLTDMIKSLESDKADIKQKIASEELLIEELTTDIELESNKPCEEDSIGTESGNEMLTLMEEKMANHKGTVAQLRRVFTQVDLDIGTSQGVIAQKQEKLAAVPKTLLQLAAMSSALRLEQSEVDANLFAQQLELRILCDVFSKPCPPLTPSYTISSALPSVMQFSVSPCPVCCNGYHGNNWIPASCGHCYHPACLFPLLSISQGAEPPKCRACGDVFTPHWLQTWGLECGWELDPDTLARHDTMTKVLKEKYGNSSSRLQQRRVLVQSLNTEVHGKGDIHVETEECLASILLSSLVVEVGDTGEDGSSRPTSEKAQRADGAGTFKISGILTPKQEPGDTPSKKRKADGDAAKKVQRTEQGFSPHATLPFSPETTTFFKPYMSIKSPCRDGPSLDGHSTAVVTKRKKRLPL